ncbi:hypothetical protein FGO68_gene3774 [Halteria grandinella]|uniref:ADP-ribosylglycohydrolase n=1 Tax=Halteria grandinella TaxID=5974 RepID=A0A8J8NSF3_HALGN|nr:hypothetical protein FGO68_gene3774 [Halteria grandinella]
MACDPRNAKDQEIQQRDRAFGSVIGAFIGDAAGAYLEFRRGGSLASKTDEVKHAIAMNGGGYWNIGKGQVTDDSELAMCLLHGLARGETDRDIKVVQVLSTLNRQNSPLNLDKIQQMFGKWFYSNPFDVGETSLLAFSVIKLDKPNPQVSFQNSLENTSKSLSNGCLMRITPLAVWGYRLSNEELYEAVKLQTHFTHSHKVAIDACYLYCFAIKQLIITGNPEIAFKATTQEAKHHKIDPTLSQWLFLIEIGEVENFPQPSQDPQGFLKIAFVWAFYYLKVGMPYQDAIYDILQRGGDTDTNAAILGGLLGARDGLSKLPTFMVDSVLSFRCDTPDMIAQYKVTHKRPDFLIPGFHLTSLLNEVFQKAPEKLIVQINGEYIIGLHRIREIIRPRMQDANRPSGKV